MAIPLASKHTDSFPKLLNMIGGSLLVHTEQGAGDAIMCARFLVAARARCKKLILVAPENLRDLLGTAAGVDEVRLPGNLPADLFDTFCPIMSLPGALGITLENLPAETPYLAVPEHVSASRLKGDGIRIGFAWRGSATMKTNHHRSCVLEDFAPLFEIPGVDWFSMQMPVSGEESEWYPGMRLFRAEPGEDWSGRIQRVKEALENILG